ncbi:MAG: ABC transporter ATP-binding protein [Alteraurantiacibacter sp.]
MGFKALLTYARPYAASLVFVAFLSMACAAALIVLPWFAGRLLGDLLQSEQINALSMALYLGGVLCALAILQAMSAIASGIVGSRIEADFKGDIFAHVQRLPMEYFDRKRQGDLLALLTWEVSRLGAFIGETLTSAPAALLTAAGAAVALYMIDPSLSLLAMVLFPTSYMAHRLIGRQISGLSTKIQIAEAAVFAAAESNLNMLPAFKAFAREENGLQGYRQVIEKLRRLKVRRQKILSTMAPALWLIAALGAVLLMLLAHQRLGGARADPATFFSFVLYVGLLVYAILSFANFLTQFNTARGTLGRLQHVLGKEAEAGYARPAIESQGGGWITFSNVWFGYPDRKNTLRGVNFDIEAGETVVLMGENGSGKTTILSLLLALYEPRKGSIKIDGCDIAQMSLQQVRGQVGYVPQRPLLQSGSIRENLLMGRANLPQDEVERACRLAQAHHFIIQLPEGYRTQIGDHGKSLSYSQRQRIALARALLADPAILVLDEATSHFDLEDEAAFIEARRSGKVNCTTIVVTHRPAMLALADRVLTLKDGKITQTGRRGVMWEMPPVGEAVTIDQPG